MKAFVPPAPVRSGPEDLIRFSVEVTQILQDIADYAAQVGTVERPWGVICRNLLLLGTPAAPPGVAAIGAGPLTGEFEYASSYRSTSLGMETGLSAVASSGVVAAQTLQITGAKSTDSQVDLVLIWRRLAGGTEKDWLLVAEVSNLGGGGWSYDDELDTTTLIAAPTFPMDFAYPLWTACGPNWFLRRVKIRWDDIFEPDPANYWQIQLRMQQEGRVATAAITKPQTTEAIRLTPQRLYNVPQANAVNEPLTPVLDLPVPENATVVLSLRGFGSVSPLPRFAVQVDAYRKEP